MILCYNTFSSSCQPENCDPRDRLSLSHSDCLHLVERTLGPLDGAQLAGIARTLRTIALWRILSEAFYPEHRLPMPDLSDISRDTELADILWKMANKLPPEIALRILGLVSDLLKHILAAQATIRYLSHYMPKFSTHEEVIRPFEEVVNLTEMFIRRTKTLDGRCLSHLGPSISTSAGSADGLIPLNQDKSIDGFQVAFDIFGVIDFRLLYSNGAKTEWLNDSKRRWVANYKTDDLREVETVSDVNFGHYVEWF